MWNKKFSESFFILRLSSLNTLFDEVILSCPQESLICILKIALFTILWIIRRSWDGKVSAGNA